MAVSWEPVPVRSQTVIAFGEGRPATLPATTAPVVAGVQRFYGFLDFAHMSAFVDVLRNEKPVHLGFDDASPAVFHLMTGPEPTGEGEP